MDELMSGAITSSLYSAGVIQIDVSEGQIAKSSVDAQRGGRSFQYCSSTCSSAGCSHNCSTHCSNHCRP